LVKTGHIGRGFASHADVRPQGFPKLRLKMLCFTAWSSNAGAPFDESREQWLISTERFQAKWTPVRVKKTR
jgi:hypothetical protein